MEPTQGPPGSPDADGTRIAADGEDEAARQEAERARTEAEHAARSAAWQAATEAAARAQRGLARWALVLAGGVLASLAFQRPDLGLFVTLASAFAWAQSWDLRERSRTGDPGADALIEPGELTRLLHQLLPAMFPIVGIVGFAMFASWSRSLDPTPEHIAATRTAIAAILVCALLLVPGVARAAAALLVRPPAHTHTARLTVSLAALALLTYAPVRLVFDRVLAGLMRSERALADTPGLIGQLVGEVVFALGAVGLGVSRGVRETCRRLGLGAMTGRDWIIAVAGLGGVSLLNASLGWTERTWFPELWQQDQAMSRLIAHDIGLGTAIVLGISAGVGEELLVRGALQPRTGLWWAALLFAVAHVQYTWFGVLYVFLLGVMLGLVRRHSNTTTAIVVHGVYDIVVAFSVGR